MHIHYILYIIYMLIDISAELKNEKGYSGAGMETFSLQIFFSLLVKSH